MNNNLFGTDGIRRTMGIPPLCAQNLPKLGTAIAQWAQKKYGQNPNILIAHDTRGSCSFVKSALKTGLLQHSITIHDAHVLPTPAVCQLVFQEEIFDLGIIISASHNPYQDNGIKLIDTHKGKLSLLDELAISNLFFDYGNNTPNYMNLGSDIPFLYGRQQYVDNITQNFSHNFLHNKKIVLDCAHGATYLVAPTIFRQLGAHVITIHNKPNGININDSCGVLHTSELQKTVINTHADIGFAFDGDGDRLMAINKDGEIKDGDDLLALLLEHPQYQKEHTVVGTIMSNKGLEVHLQQHNKQLIRTAVGDKYVAEQLEQHNLLLGAEQSGHIIIRDYLNTGDGIFTALRTLESIMYTNNWDLHTFKKFPQIIINVPISYKKDLTCAPLAHIIDTHKLQLPNGRLIVRYSGTENVVRVMIENDDAKQAQIVGNALSHALAEQLG